MTRKLQEQSQERACLDEELTEMKLRVKQLQVAKEEEKKILEEKVSNLEKELERR